MRIRLGIALLLLTLAGGGLLVALRNRKEPPPAPPLEPPGVIAPAVSPELPPSRKPVESRPVADPGAPLETVPRELDLPSEPDGVTVRDGAGLELHTTTEGVNTPVVEATPPKPPVETVPEVVPDPPVAPPPEEPPEEPPGQGEEDAEDSTLVTGKDAAPLAGPIDDPSDLPTSEEIEEGRPPEAEKVPPKEETFLSNLNDFMRIMTLDGRIHLKFTGRLYIDAALMNAEQSLEDTVGDFNDGWEFRAARLGVLGVIDWFEFKVDYDIAGGQTLIGEPDLKDLWIGARDIPVIGRLRVGRMKEPLGLEQWMSGNARTFLEPGLPNALTSGRNPGVLAWATELEGRLFWWAGVFGQPSGSNQFGVFGKNLAARVCGTPLFDPEEKRLLHLGLSASLMLSESDEMSIAQRPEAHLAPNIVFTPDCVARNQNFVGLEAAYRDGPFSIQAEWMRYHVNSADQGAATYWGAYLYGSYILTGEYRRYRNGAFLRPQVAQAAFTEGIGGALEIAARLSHLDLNSGQLEGGTVTDGTLGLTWYMDDHSRFMLNYIRTDREGVGTANILQCRLQIDF